MKRAHPANPWYFAWRAETRDDRPLTTFQAGWDAAIAHASRPSPVLSPRAEQAWPRPVADLSPRAQRVLDYHGIDSPEELAKRSLVEVSILKGVGPTVLDELVRWLNSHGLSMLDIKAELGRPKPGEPCQR